MRDSSASMTVILNVSYQGDAEKTVMSHTRETLRKQSQRYTCGPAVTPAKRGAKGRRNGCQNFTPSEPANGRTQQCRNYSVSCSFWSAYGLMR